jgi:hypothetical protein
LPRRPNYNWNQIAAQWNQYSPHQQATFQAARAAENQPLSYDLPGGGKVFYWPQNPSRQYYQPNIQKEPFQLGDLHTERYFVIAPNGGRQYLRSGSSTAGQGGTMPAPGTGQITGREAFNSNWDEPTLIEWNRKRQALQKGEETASTELAKRQTKPINEAMERGNTAQKDVQLLNTLELLSQQTPAALSGPFSREFIGAGQALSELSGGTLGWSTASAEGIQKLNYALASLAAREITNRPALAEFSSMVSSNPGLANSPEGRAMLVNIIRQGAQQDIQLSKLASKVKDPSEWADTRDKYISEHPINITCKGKTYSADSEGIANLKKELGASPSSGTTEFQPPPQAAIDYLRKNPGARDQFDEKYGKGAADRVLGK